MVLTQDLIGQFDSSLFNFIHIHNFFILYFDYYRMQQMQPVIKFEDNSLDLHILKERCNNFCYYSKMFSIHIYLFCINLLMNMVDFGSYFDEYLPNIEHWSLF